MSETTTASTTDLLVAYVRSERPDWDEQEVRAVIGQAVTNGHVHSKIAISLVQLAHTPGSEPRDFSPARFLPNGLPVSSRRTA
jgi:hypothetical protein